MKLRKDGFIDPCPRKIFIEDLILEINKISEDPTAHIILMMDGNEVIGEETDGVLRLILMVSVSVSVERSRNKFWTPNQSVSVFVGEILLRLSQEHPLLRTCSQSVLIRSYVDIIRFSPTPPYSTHILLHGSVQTTLFTGDFVLHFVV